MIPVPISDDPNYVGSNKLRDKVAIITGGDSGIGRAVSIAFAKEGADVTIVYLSERENQDALDTKNIVESYGRKALLIQGDLTNESFCAKVVNDTINKYGHLDVLVNNAGILYEDEDIGSVPTEQLLEIFKTNVFSYFYMTKEAIKHMKRGSSIVNTASIAAYEAFPNLVEYSASKGAVVAFTQSLASNLIKKGIRVNAVAPNETWTPLVPSSMSENEVMSFGSETLIGRAAQPFELAPAYVYLASNISSSYVTGKVIKF